MISLEKKIQILDKCKGGLSVVAVGRIFGINESTVRSIKKQEDLIRQAVGEGRNKKTLRYARDEVLVKMEIELLDWLEKKLKMNEHLTNLKIREEALRIYYKIKEDDGKNSFTGSNGWFQHFKKRFAKKLEGFERYVSVFI